MACYSLMMTTTMMMMAVVTSCVNEILYCAVMMQRRSDIGRNGAGSSD